MTERPSTHTENSAIIWIVCAALLAIYVAVPTRNYFFDGIEFSWAIEHAKALDTSLVHPNHLIYEGIGYLFYHLLVSLGINLRAIAALEILDSLFSVASAFVLYQILRSCFRNVYLNLSLTLLFAFSATWWKFSTDADAYIAATLFLLISFYFLLPAKKSRPELVALAFSIAMCFHQLAIVFGPVVVVGLIFQNAAAGSRKTLIALIRFAVVGFVLTLGSYYACFVSASGHRSVSVFAHWLTSFSPDGGFSFNVGHALMYTLRGHARLFFGGRVNLLSGLMNPLVIILLLVFVVVVLALIVQLVRGLRQTSFARVSKQRSLLILSLTWIASYLIFLFVWMPQHTFYRLMYLPAIMLLIRLFLPTESKRYYRLALLVAALALSNFLFLIYPYSHEDKFPPLAFARVMSGFWNDGTIVIYSLTNSDESLFRYFNPQTQWVQLANASPNEIEQELLNAAATGGNVWLDVTAMEALSATPQGKQWLAEHTKPGSEHELKNPLFKIRFVQLKE